MRGFKVGNFVNTKDNKAHRVVFDSMALLSDPPQYVTQCNDGVFLTKDLELWKPRKSDWCWYGFELVQVIDVDSQHIKICRQQSDSYEEILASSLEPFIGNLPQCIKDSK